MRRETCVAILVALTLLPLTAIAKDLDAAGAPAAGSGMPTLQEIYDYLVSGVEPSGFEMGMTASPVSFSQSSSSGSLDTATMLPTRVP